MYDTHDVGEGGVCFKEKANKTQLAQTMLYQFNDGCESAYTQSFQFWVDFQFECMHFAIWIEYVVGMRPIEWLCDGNECEQLALFEYG